MGHLHGSLGFTRVRVLRLSEWSTETRLLMLQATGDWVGAFHQAQHGQYTRGACHFGLVSVLLMHV